MWPRNAAKPLQGVAKHQKLLLYILKLSFYDNHNYYAIVHTSRSPVTRNKHLDVVASVEIFVSVEFCTKRPLIVKVDRNLRLVNSLEPSYL